MEEKTILRTENNTQLKFAKFLICSIVFFFVSWILIDLCSGEKQIETLLSFKFYRLDEWLYAELLIAFAIGLIPLLLYIICKLIIANELVVTDKRVYGKIALGKRVDLPLDSISAVVLTITLLQGISISTSSGRISFYFIEKPKEFHKEISDLIINRQSKTNLNTTTFKQETPFSNADEIKKYKNLFDNGIITQEEFEAKKKQLLDL